jgi:hypothetical protein
MIKQESKNFYSVIIIKDPYSLGMIIFYKSISIQLLFVFYLSIEAFDFNFILLLLIYKYY